MGLLDGIRHRPRQLGLRRILFQVHLWAGIAIGLYLFAMGLTGSALVFEEELEGALHPHLFRAEGSGTPQARIADLLRAAQSAWPDRQVTAIYGPTEENQNFVVYLRKGEEILHAYVHPATAQVVGSTLPSTSAVRWMQDFHFNLFSGRTGRSVNGIGGLLLFMLALTGIVIWWPGVSVWKNALRIDFGRNWKRLNWETHSAVGFWTAAVLSIWALSGFYFGYSIPLSGFVNHFSPLSQVEAPESRPSAKKQPVDPDFLVSEAQAKAPAGHFYGLQLPAGKRAAYIVFMSRESPGEKRTSDYFYFDQYSGRFLKVWRRGISVSWGDMLINAAVPLHFGTFAGQFSRIAWAILGLVPPLMFLTGFTMWWNRVISRRRARVTKPI